MSPEEIIRLAISETAAQRHVVVQPNIKDNILKTVLKKIDQLENSQAVEYTPDTEVTGLNPFSGSQDISSHVSPGQEISINEKTDTDS